MENKKIAPEMRNHAGFARVAAQNRNLNAASSPNV